MLGLRSAQEDCQVSGKIRGLNLGPPLKLTVLSGREVCGMRGVAVKCIDIRRNTGGEGGLLD